ncbi:type II secretion system protein [Aquabacterium sp. A7-Y]|uniref:type II secretion system protein n=1 Tax=Aquabacterium sp. A7-Y TaxID=1349605 RepID=UPI00223E546B|nr:type II secretion system protein [Aquabacterium sp. A7-Y]MCW7541276.1 type II secretion system protein [Aquabacterium sp. A7-Y]
MLAILSAGLAAVGQLWSAAAERERARQLAWTGEQFVQAIASYYHSAPNGQKRYPPDLQALLLDPRFLSTRRHLRRIYLDPYSGRAGWGLVAAPGGGIMGVYPLAQGGGGTISRFVYRDPAAQGRP